MKELQVIRQEIQSTEYISYDNILFIYNQLIGLTIKYLRENNINTARIFAGRRDIYSAIASIDTLDEMEDYLNGFLQKSAGISLIFVLRTVMVNESLDIFRNISVKTLFFRI